MAELTRRPGKIVTKKIQYGYEDDSYTIDCGNGGNLQIQYGTDGKSVVNFDGKDSATFAGTIYAPTPKRDESGNLRNDAVTTVEFVKNEVQKAAEAGNDVFDAFRDFIEDFQIDLSGISTMDKK